MIASASSYPEAAGEQSEFPPKKSPQITGATPNAQSGRTRAWRAQHSPLEVRTLRADVAMGSMFK